MILTIEHSTRQIREFIALLVANGVRMVVDVRTVPRSRHNPQFNRNSLPEMLAREGIGYIHMPGLGGLRHTTSDSPNRGWRNTSFRGFADYMQTDAFSEKITELIEFGTLQCVALMCAEALPWRCHRSLIADALVARGVGVAHILGKIDPVAHELTAFARVDGSRVFYPAGEGQEREERYD